MVENFAGTPPEGLVQNGDEPQKDAWQHREDQVSKAMAEVRVFGIPGEFPILEKKMRLFNRLIQRKHYSPPPKVSNF